MTNIVLAGVGGQGTVLAAKVLATAAASKGWTVRSAETIGMSQRGGSVVSHVKMAEDGAPVHSSLVMRGRADVVIAFEPGEAARTLEYLAPEGVLICATTPVEPVSAALSDAGYDAQAIIEGIQRSLAHTGERQAQCHFVPDDAIIDSIGGNRKILNTVMLAKAAAFGCMPLSVEDIRAAVAACVKPAFVDMNMRAIDAVLCA